MNPTLLHTFIVPPIWLAALLAALLAGGSYALRWLTLSGAIATFCVGLVVYGLGQWQAAAPLLAFFISSSLLSKLGKLSKAARGIPVEKGDRRNAWQVGANGGLATAFVLLHYLLARHLTPTIMTLDRYLPMLFLAALATVNADTWATEIGSLAGGTPRLLSNWRPAPPGTSGAISFVGTLAAAGGALFIPLCAYRLWPIATPELITIAWAGFLGSFFDSILGASLQGQFRDAVTGEPTEQNASNGKPAILLRGLRWVNNDMVNLLASIGGALCAWALLRYGVYPFQ